MRFSLRALIVVLVYFAGSLNAYAESPEIANIFPDFPMRGVVHIITGENFDANTRVICQSPPSDIATIQESLSKMDEPPVVPRKPPKTARFLKPIDVENQVIVLNIPPHFNATMVWVANRDGVSEPYTMNVAKPFWLSHERAHQGEIVYTYGFGFRVLYRKTYIALKNQFTTEFVEPLRMSRARRIRDPRLLYFRIPIKLQPGGYDVYIHNSLGGEYGWGKAGILEVLPRKRKKPRILNVRDSGARRDGIPMTPLLSKKLSNLQASEA